MYILIFPAIPKQKIKKIQKNSKTKKAKNNNFLKKRRMIKEKKSETMSKYL
jgi:hypothetical protein